MKKFSPPQIIVASFLLVIVIGAALLACPWSSGNGKSVGLVDAVFTATSATCVTGLVVVPIFDGWSPFGKVVILALVQIGALGSLTILNLGILLLKRKMSLKDRLIVQASFNQDSIGGMAKLVKHVVLISFAFEALGALLLCIAFYASSPMSVRHALYQGVFHAISAFCNAGFDNVGPHGLSSYQTNATINIVVMLLIISGGLGFTVLTELVQRLKAQRLKAVRRVRSLSLHSKIALVITAILIASGTLFFAVFEWNNPLTMGPLSTPHKLLASAFQSVSLRTAGFNTIDQGALKDISKAFSCVLMFIGGSPAGTAGGIKTVTLGVILFSMLSVLKGKRYVEAFGRTLPVDLLQKALTVACALIAVIFFSTIILYFSENDGPVQYAFLDTLFETCSAVGTVGVSAGLTPHLTNVGKVVIAVCMFIGRLSPVTIVVALNMKLEANFAGQKYLDDKVIIG
jgi:trk system potassium uptake protein TrkH